MPPSPPRPFSPATVPASVTRLQDFAGAVRAHATASGAAASLGPARLFAGRAGAPLGLGASAQSLSHNIAARWGHGLTSASARDGDLPLALARRRFAPAAAEHGLAERERPDLLLSLGRPPLPLVSQLGVAPRTPEPSLGEPVPGSARGAAAFVPAARPAFVPVASAGTPLVRPARDAADAARPRFVSRPMPFDLPRPMAPGRRSDPPARGTDFSAALATTTPERGGAPLQRAVAPMSLPARSGIARAGIVASAFSDHLSRRSHNSAEAAAAAAAVTPDPPRQSAPTRSVGPFLFPPPAAARHTLTQNELGQVVHSALPGAAGLATARFVDGLRSGRRSDARSDHSRRNQGHETGVLRGGVAGVAARSISDGAASLGAPGPFALARPRSVSAERGGEAVLQRAVAAAPGQNRAPRAAFAPFAADATRAEKGALERAFPQGGGARRLSDSVAEKGASLRSAAPFVAPPTFLSTGRAARPMSGQFASVAAAAAAPLFSLSAGVAVMQRQAAPQAGTPRNIAALSRARAARSGPDAAVAGTGSGGSAAVSPLPFFASYAAAPLALARRRQQGPSEAVSSSGLGVARATAPSRHAPPMVGGGVGSGRQGFASVAAAAAEQDSAATWIPAVARAAGAIGVGRGIGSPRFAVRSPQTSFAAAPAAAPALVLQRQAIRRQTNANAAPFAPFAARLAPQPLALAGAASPAAASSPGAALLTAPGRNAGRERGAENGLGAVVAEKQSEVQTAGRTRWPDPRARSKITSSLPAAAAAAAAASAALAGTAPFPTTPPSFAASLPVQPLQPLQRATAQPVIGAGSTAGGGARADLARLPLLALAAGRRAATGAAAGNAATERFLAATDAGGFAAGAGISRVPRTLPGVDADRVSSGISIGSRIGARAPGQRAETRPMAFAPMLPARGERQNAEQPLVNASVPAAAARTVPAAARPAALQRFAAATTSANIARANGVSTGAARRGAPMQPLALASQKPLSFARPAAGDQSFASALSSAQISGVGGAPFALSGAPRRPAQTLPQRAAQPLALPLAGSVAARHAGPAVVFSRSANAHGADGTVLQRAVAAPSFRPLSFAPTTRAANTSNGRGSAAGATPASHLSAPPAGAPAALPVAAARAVGHAETTSRLSLASGPLAFPASSGDGVSARATRDFVARAARRARLMPALAGTTATVGAVEAFGMDVAAGNARPRAHYPFAGRSFVRPVPAVAPIQRAVSVASRPAAAPGALAATSSAPLLWRSLSALPGSRPGTFGMAGRRGGATYPFAPALAFLGSASPPLLAGPIQRSAAPGAVPGSALTAPPPPPGALAARPARSRVAPRPDDATGTAPAAATTVLPAGRTAPLSATTGWTPSRQAAAPGSGAGTAITAAAPALTSAPGVGAFGARLFAKRSAGLGRGGPEAHAATSNGGAAGISAAPFFAAPFASFLSGLRPGGASSLIGGTAMDRTAGLLQGRRDLPLASGSGARNTAPAAATTAENVLAQQTAPRAAQPITSRRVVGGEAAGPIQRMAVAAGAVAPAPALAPAVPGFSGRSAAAQMFGRQRALSAVPAAAHAAHAARATAASPWERASSSGGGDFGDAPIFQSFGQHSRRPGTSLPLARTLLGRPIPNGEFADTRFGAAASGVPGRALAATNGASLTNQAALAGRAGVAAEPAPIQRAVAPHAAMVSARRQPRIPLSPISAAGASAGFNTTNAAGVFRAPFSTSAAIPSRAETSLLPLPLPLSRFAGRHNGGGAATGATGAYGSAAGAPRNVPIGARGAAAVPPARQDAGARPVPARAAAVAAPVAAPVLPLLLARSKPDSLPQPGESGRNAVLPVRSPFLPSAAARPFLSSSPDVVQRRAAPASGAPPVAAFASPRAPLARFAPADRLHAAGNGASKALGRNDAPFSFALSTVPQSLTRLSRPEAAPSPGVFGVSSSGTDRSDHSAARRFGPEMASGGRVSAFGSTGIPGALARLATGVAAGGDSPFVFGRTAGRPGVIGGAERTAAAPVGLALSWAKPTATVPARLGHIAARSFAPSVFSTASSASVVQRRAENGAAAAPPAQRAPAPAARVTNRLGARTTAAAAAASLDRFAASSHGFGFSSPSLPLATLPALLARDDHNGREHNANGGGGGGAGAPAVMSQIPGFSARRGGSLLGGGARSETALPALAAPAAFVPSARWRNANSRPALATASGEVLQRKTAVTANEFGNKAAAAKSSGTFSFARPFAPPAAARLAPVAPQATKTNDPAAAQQAFSAGHVPAFAPARPFAPSPLPPTTGVSAAAATAAAETPAFMERFAGAANETTALPASAKAAMATTAPLSLAALPAAQRASRFATAAAFDASQPQDDPAEHAASRAAVIASAMASLGGLAAARANNLSGHAPTMALAPPLPARGSNGAAGGASGLSVQRAPAGSGGRGARAGAAEASPDVSAAAAAAKTEEVHDPAKAANDVHLLASEVWSLLKRRLAVEAERRGRF